MVNYQKIITILLGVMLAASMAQSALAATGTLFVEVKKGTSPESGVTVKVFKGIDQVGNPDTTGNDGTAKFENLTIGTRYLVNAVKGNSTGSSDVTFSQDRQQVVITLSQQSTGTGDEESRADAAGGGTVPKITGFESAKGLSFYISDPKTPVRRVWKAMLVLANIVVVMILLAVAFATIFHVQVDTYGIKKVLPTLIAGVILSNLSLLISRNIIDFAGVLSATFINAGGGKEKLIEGLTNSIIAGGAAKLGEFLSSEANLAGGITVAGIALNAAIVGGLGPLIVLGFFLIIAILLFIPAILFAILAFLLYARTVILVFLVAVSPVAFIAMAFAPTQGLFRQWWTQFMRWTFMAPLVFFFLWLAIEFGLVVGGKDAGGATFATYALALLMVYLAIQVPFKLGGAVMSVYGGVGRKAATFLGAKALDRSQSFAERKFGWSPRVVWEQAKKKEEERATIAKELAGAKIAKGMYTKYGPPTSGIKALGVKSPGIIGYIQGALGKGEGAKVRERMGKIAEARFGESATRYRQAQEYLKQFPNLATIKQAQQAGDEILNTAEAQTLIKQMETQQLAAVNPTKQFEEVFDLRDKFQDETSAQGGIDSILREILKVLKQPGGNKNTATYVATALAGLGRQYFKKDVFDDKGKPKSFEQMRFENLTDKGQQRLQEQLRKLSWGDQDIGNMSEESRSQLQRFFGGGSDWAQVVRAGGTGAPPANPLRNTPEIKAITTAAAANQAISEIGRLRSSLVGLLNETDLTKIGKVKDEIETSPHIPTDIRTSIVRQNVVAEPGHSQALEHINQVLQAIEEHRKELK